MTEISAACQRYGKKKKKLQPRLVEGLISKSERTGQRYFHTNWMHRADVNCSCTQFRIYNIQIRFVCVPAEIIVGVFGSFAFCSVLQIKMIWIRERQIDRQRDRERWKVGKRNNEKKERMWCFGTKKKKTKREEVVERGIKVCLTLVSYLTEHSTSFTPRLRPLCPGCVWLQEESWRSKRELKPSMNEGRKEGSKDVRQIKETNDRVKNGHSKNPLLIFSLW